MSDEYIPRLFMAKSVGGKVVECYFTNGAVRRYDVSEAIKLGGVFAPLADQELFERSMMIVDGTLSFDISGKNDPYDMVDICPEVIYAAA